MQMISRQYRLGESTMSEFLVPVCNAIWDRLKTHVFPTLDEDFWRYQEAGFRELWNFPHCIGAVDGKHVQIEALLKSGSLFFNYKYYFSVVLLAVAGFDYRFTFVDSLPVAQ